jgi:hypothetical protein
MLGIITDFKTAAEAGSKQKTFIGQASMLALKASAYLNLTTGSSNHQRAQIKHNLIFIWNTKTK